MHHRKLPWLRLALLTAVTVIATISLTKLTFDPATTVSPPEDDFFRALEASDARFLSNDFVVVTVEHDDIFSKEAVGRIGEITDELSELSEVSGVLSFTTLAEVDADDGFALNRLVDPAQAVSETDIEALESFLDRHSFISELTTTAGGDGAAVVVFPADGADKIDMAGAVFEATDRLGIPREHVFGVPVLRFYAARDNIHDSASLLILALIVVFLVELLVTRRPALAIVLWWSAVTSVIWTMGLFIIFDIELSVETMVIPVTVLALATSYGIHIHRYHATHIDEDFRHNVRQATSIVLVAGITTVAGFASLALSRIPTLRTIGLICATGVGFSMLISLIYMAPIYERVSRRFSVRPSIFGWAKPRASRTVAMVTTVACLAVGIGGLRVYINPRYSSAFRAHSDPTRAMEYFEEHYYSGDTVELHLDTEEEYGLVDMETYESVEVITERLEALEGVAGVYSFTDIVGWFNGGPPESAVDIGESLEMLAGAEVGLNVGAFVDVGYRATKIIIRPEPSEHGHREFSDTVDAIEERLPVIIEESGFEGSTLVGGTSPYIRRINEYFARGQITGVAAFLLAVCLVTVLFLKKIRLALIALIPPVLSSLVYIGFVGWSGEPLNIAASVGFATVLGVSVDDIMYFLLYQRNLARSRNAAPIGEAVRKAGPAIIETTVVLVCGVSVLLTSRYLNLAWTGAYIIAGLITPTVVTLEVVPIIMGSRRNKTEELPA